MSSKHLIGWRLALVGCAAAVVVLALMPIGPTTPSIGWDKADHLFAFAVLGLLGMKAFPRSQAACMGGVLAFGIVVELLQAAVPYRFAEWRDIVANAVGIVIGIAVNRVPSLFPSVERPVTAEQRLP
jgi:VanZ family protein